MRYFLIIFFVFIFVFIGLAQRHEVGVFGGTSYYIGDINPNRHFLSSSLAYGLVYKYNIDKRFALKTAIVRGQIEGADSVSLHRPTRNLSFVSPLTDLSVQVELNFLKYISGDKEYWYSPYLFIGLARYWYNPKANYQDRWFELQPLGTEGQGFYNQRKPYKLNGWAIPFGLGAKLNITKSLVVSVEWSMRKTYTDYLDDVSTTYVNQSVLKAKNSRFSAIFADRSSEIGSPANLIDSQRGNSQNKDWYSIAGITVMYKIPKSKKQCDAYKNKVDYLRFLNLRGMNLFNLF